MSYLGALERISERSEQGMRLGLETTRSLLAALGDPQAGMPGVLVAGTNGKGSVCAMVAGVARAAGYRVALLTKPHLTSYRERIELFGEAISEAAFIDIADQVISGISRMVPRAGGPTHHEILTAMGFLAAREYRAELVVCEVGLGGRLDASNVWDGGVAAIVTVALDHQAQLGNTVPEIAREKAAIIKPRNRVVSGVGPEALPQVESATLANHASLWQLGREIQATTAEGGASVVTPGRQLDRLQLSAAGAFQVTNAGLAVAIADRLGEIGFPIADQAVREGLATLYWPGRLDLVARGPDVLVDAAHNPDAVQTILPELRRRGAEHSQLVLLFGSMSDHDHAGMLRWLLELAPSAMVLTSARSARAEPASSLAKEWAGPSEIQGSVSAALSRARQLAGAEGLVVALGSIYLIGEVMAELGVGLPPDPQLTRPPLW